MQHEADTPPRIRCALVALALIALAGCGDGPVPTAQATADAWLRAPQTPDAAAVELPAWLVYPVADAVREEAIAELETEPYIQISPHMASRYAGQDVRVPAEMRPFLVRAVAAPDATMRVIQSSTGLWLRAEGGDSTAARRAPRVVLVDPTPVEIFVTVE